MPDIRRELAKLLAKFDSEKKKEQLAQKVAELLCVEHPRESLRQAAENRLNRSLNEEESYKLETLEQSLNLPKTAD